MICFDSNELLRYGVYEEKYPFITTGASILGTYGVCLNAQMPNAVCVILPILMCLAVKKGIKVSKDFFFDHDVEVNMLLNNYSEIINYILDIGIKLRLENPIDYFVLTEYLYNNGFLVPNNRLRKFNVDGFYSFYSKIKKEIAIGNKGSGRERNLLLTDVLINAGFKANFDVGNFSYGQNDERDKLLDYLIKEKFFIEHDKQGLVCPSSAAPFKALDSLDDNFKRTEFIDLASSDRESRYLLIKPNYTLTKVLIDDYLLYLDLYKDRYFTLVEDEIFKSKLGNIFIRDYYESFVDRYEYQLQEIEGETNISEKVVDEMLADSEKKINDNISLINESSSKILELTQNQLGIIKNIENRLI